MERYTSQIKYNIKLILWIKLGKSRAAADELSLLGVLHFWYFIKQKIKKVMKKFILPGFWTKTPTENSLDLNNEIGTFMNSQGYPVKDCCESSTDLVTRSYANEAAAKAAGLKKGDLFHTAGALKVILT